MWLIGTVRRSARSTGLARAPTSDRWPRESGAPRRTGPARRGSVGLLASVVLASLGGCGADVGGSLAVADSAGVLILSTPAEPPALAWSADTTRSFGGEERGLDSFYRVTPALVDVDRRGWIYVLDPGKHRVVVFDSTGRALGAMGSEGEGPGELEFPLAVTALGDGRALVHDGNGRLVSVALGTERGTDTAFPFAVIHMGFRQVLSTPTGLLVWVRQPFAQRDRRDRLLWIVGSDTTRLISGKSTHMTTARYPRCGMAFSIHQPLAPRIRWARWGERVALSAWGGFRVNIYDGGRLTAVLRSEDAEEETDRGEAVALLEAMEYKGPCNAGPEEVVRKHGYFPRPQVVRDVAVTPEGHVWIRVVGSDGRRILVFDPRRRTLARLPKGFPMPVAFLPDGRLLIRTVDAVDIERIAIVEVRQ